jgi:peptide/nickel transport system substrate-binding protein
MQGERGAMNGIPGDTLTRRGVIGGTAAAGAAALLGGIGQASAIAAGGWLRVLDAAALQEGGPGTLIVSVPAAPDAFDPHATGGWDTYKHTLQMFEGLTRSENLTEPGAEPGVLAQSLADGWEVSDDGKTYTFHLRPEVKFHDGTDFNADAVEFNVRRIWDKDFEFYYPRANTFTSYVFEFLDNIEAVDDFTVRMDLKYPFAEFLHMQNQSYGEVLMVSPEAVRTHGNEAFAHHPIGTGRFMLAERREGESTTLVRFADHWDTLDEARLERIIFQVIPDPQEAVSALKAGRTDMMLWVPPEHLADLEASGFTISINDGPCVNFWYLNFRNDITAREEIRKALNIGFNRQRIVDELTYRSQVAANGIIPPGCPAYDQSLTGFAHDPEQAKALVAQAGFPDGVDVTFLVADYGQYGAAWLARILEEWAEIGVRVRLERLEWVTYMHTWANGLSPEYGGLLLGWGMNVNYWLQYIAHSRYQPPNGKNAGYYSNPDVDALLDKAAEEPNVADQRGPYQEAQRIFLHGDAAFVPITFDRAPMAISPRVKGFINPPENWFQLWTVSLDEAGAVGTATP